MSASRATGRDGAKGAPGAGADEASATDATDDARASEGTGASASRPAAGDPAEPRAGDADRADRGEDAARGVDDPSGTGGRGPTLERASGAKLTLGRLVRAVKGVPAFGRLLFGLLSDGRVSLLDRALFGATLVYLFVPVDLVPDWIVGLGQLDDLLLVLFTLDRLLYRTDPDVLLDHWDADPEILLTLRDLLERSADTLPGWARKLLRAG